MVLLRLKKAAELHFNMPVRDVVITVPAYFSDAQRQACARWLPRRRSVEPALQALSPRLPV